MFANTYPSTVTGMILIDSAHPDQQRRFAEVLPSRSADDLPCCVDFATGRMCQSWVSGSTLRGIRSSCETSRGWVTSH
jgi:hypothetical protein